MLTKGMMSSNKQDYETDKKLIELIKEEFKIDLDFCSNRNNVCDNYFTKEQDCFKQNISKYKIIWCNPPYKESYKFIKHLIDNNKTFIALLPSRTDTKLFHELIQPNCDIYFIKGRLKFNTNKSAPFPSMLIFHNCLRNNNNHYKDNTSWYNLKISLEKNNY